MERIGILRSMRWPHRQNFDICIAPIEATLASLIVPFTGKIPYERRSTETTSKDLYRVKQPDGKIATLTLKTFQDFMDIEFSIRSGPDFEKCIYNE